MNGMGLAIMHKLFGLLHSCNDDSGCRLWTQVLYMYIHVHVYTCTCMCQSQENSYAKDFISTYMYIHGLGIAESTTLIYLFVCLVFVYFFTCLFLFG